MSMPLAHWSIALVAAMHANKLALAERLYRAGLDLLTAEETNSFYKAVAAQGLAKCRDLQGDVRGGLRFLAIAVEEADPRCTQLRAALLYTAANTERRMQHFDEAEFKYWEALAICEETDDADSAIRVCIDLSVCLIKAGREAALSNGAGDPHAVPAEATKRTNPPAGMRAAPKRTLARIPECRGLESHRTPTGEWRSGGHVGVTATQPIQPPGSTVIPHSSVEASGVPSPTSPTV